MVGDDFNDLGDDSPPDANLIDEPQFDAQPMCHHLQLSALSSNGFDGPQTMKLFGRVGETQVRVMVDSGASHCFISEHVATKLNWDIEPTSSFSVMLGDGTRVRAGGICNDVPLLLDSKLFSISCYVFPLSSIDIILGVSWLETLGDVKANWKKLTMEFAVGGHKRCLQGDPTLMRKSCTYQELQSLELGDECWILWHLDGEMVSSPSGISKSLSEVDQSALEAVLSAFPLVSALPTGLPPTRTTDHRIELQPGAQPVSVRPYRYNHLQKDEMERLVEEMLASGIDQLN